MLLGLALVCVAAVTWGTTGSVMALLAREGRPTPLGVGWARMAGAAPCRLLATALGRPAKPRPVPWPPRDMLKAAMLGIAMAAYQLCYFWAVPRTGVALTALLAICSAPIMITAGATLALKERPSRSTLVALLLAVGGTAMVLVGPRVSGDTRQEFVAGAAAAIGAGPSYRGGAADAQGPRPPAPPPPPAAVPLPPR